MSAEAAHHRAEVTVMRAGVDLAALAATALGPMDDASARDDAWRIAYGALDIARLLADAPYGALFACDGPRLRLLALRGVAQEGLERLHAVWSHAASDLAQGRPCLRDKPPFVALPCLDEAGLAGLLFLAWSGKAASVAPSGLAALGRVLATLLRRFACVPAGAPKAGAAGRTTAAPRAVALTTLMEEHEWNVARVARALGVTRTTVYNRLRRAGVPRERIRKTARKEPAPAEIMPTAPRAE